MNWQNILNNLLDQVTIEELAERACTGQVILEQLQDGKMLEPRFSLGMRLLDLHLDLCPDQHYPGKIALDLH